MATSDSTTLKRCSKKNNCIHPEAKDGWLPATTAYFCRDKNRKDGLFSQCKVCHNARHRHYYAEHSEQWIEYNRRSRLVNSQQKREYDRLWRARNPQKKLEQTRQWRAKNREMARSQVRNREARIIAAPGTHTAADIEIQFKRQRGKCYYCGCKLTKKPRLPHSATVDHVIPLTRDNTSNAPDNLVIACRTCNFSKGNKLPHEWLKGGRLL